MGFLSRKPADPDPEHEAKTFVAYLMPDHRPLWPATWDTATRASPSRHVTPRRSSISWANHQTSYGSGGQSRESARRHAPQGREQDYPPQERRVPALRQGSCPLRQQPLIGRSGEQKVSRETPWATPLNSLEGILHASRPQATSTASAEFPRNTMQSNNKTPHQQGFFLLFR